MSTTAGAAGGTVHAARYVVGIDLGTTNSAVAYADLVVAKRQGLRAVKPFPIAQLTGQSVTESRPLLPSAIFVPTDTDRAGIALPFDPNARDAVGQYAREIGAKVPGRLVVSAKSWLCHAAVDRRSAILPVSAPADVERRSPVDASARILDHIRRAWDAAHPDAPLAEQNVVLAVPASFDAAARALTLEAASRAGIASKLVLVEEPQAAFYDYYASSEEALRKERKTRLVLVVDVGGGTTDLTLIRVGFEGPAGDEATELAPPPVLQRLAVGDHILLGGDNMDMALARLVEDKLGAEKLGGGRLEPARWALLVEACRTAKETLLSEGAPERVRVVIPGRGSRLIGGSISCDLERSEALSVVVGGFFPDSHLGDTVKRTVRSGLAQLGLPYESDPALTRHVTAFLGRHSKTSGEGVESDDADDRCGFALPDALLLNGGVFQSATLTARLQDALREAGVPLELLAHGSLDLAVARGAATYGLVREGYGTRIGGGSPRSVYVEVGAEVGKAQEGRRAVCLIPRGHDDLEPLRLGSRTFQLRVGRPVEFRLLATSSTARRDSPGDLVRVDGDDFLALPSVQMMLPGDGGRAEIPVQLEATLTDVGVLDVACVAIDRDRRWRLEFDLRAQSGVSADLAEDDVTAPARGRQPLTPTQEARAAEAIEKIFGKTPATDTKPKDVRQLRETLRACLGLPKEDWTLPMLRGLWELLAPHTKRRRRTADHEAVFLNLAGYFLRPGFGYPLDEWRIKELWQLFGQDVQYHQEDPVWHAWWVLWRRVVGGLDAGQQKQLLASVRAWLRPTDADLAALKKTKRQVKGQEEMLRLVGSLELIDPGAKADWGEWLLGEIEGGRALTTTMWTLARLGARAPFTGAALNTVDPEIAEAWLERLMKLSWKKVDGAAFAAAHIARRTDDRLRDVSPEWQDRVARQLEAMGDRELAGIVRQAVALERENEARFVGDALPPGLIL
jgi:hypothetical protein